MADIYAISRAPVRPCQPAKKRKPKFHRKSGVLAIPRVMIKSEAYKHLSGKGAKLLLILQDVYNPNEYVVHYSTKRAAEAMQMSHPTVCKAFQELMEKGFIELVGLHDWMNGLAREWRLTWLPFKGREPTDEWQVWKPDNDMKN